MRFVAVLALALLTLIYTGCDKKKKQQDTVQLQLGKPGEIKTENTLPKSDNVHILEKDERIDFNKDSGEATVIHHSDRQIRAGDLIVANGDQRFLLRVKDVNERNATSTQLVLRQSRLNELMRDQSGKLKLEATPKYDLKDIDGYLKKVQNSSDDKSVYEVDENGKLTIRHVDLLNIEVNPQGHFSIPAKGVAAGASKITNEKINVMKGAAGSYKVHLNEAKIEIIPTIRNEANWNKGRIDTMKTRFDTRVRYSVDITYKLAGEMNLDAAVDLLPTKKIPILIPGTVPVYLEVELAIPAGITVTGTGASEARVVYSAEYDFYAQTDYTPASGMKTNHDQATRVMEKSVEVSSKNVSVSAELYLKPSIKTRIYRVLGPYAYLQPYVRGELEVPARAMKDDLFVGVGGGVGFEFTEPIFLSTVLEYDSNRIFDFYMSWDLDNYKGPAASAISFEKPNAVNVDNIGDEGFVVLNAKTLGSDNGARFELVTQPHDGILVPSENFFTDGQLYYYPIRNKQNDQFVLRVLSANGQRQDIAVQTNLAPKVTEAIAKERFGLVTNSYRVVTEGSEPFANDVPHYGIGGGGFRVVLAPVAPVASQRTQLLSRCIYGDPTPIEQLLNIFKDSSRVTEHMAEVCDSLSAALLTPIKAEFEEFQARNRILPDPVVEEDRKAEFDFLKSLKNVWQYTILRHVLGCQSAPMTIEIKEGRLQISMPMCEAMDPSPTMNLYFVQALFPVVFAPQRNLMNSNLVNGAPNGFLAAVRLQSGPELLRDYFNPDAVFDMNFINNRAVFTTNLDHIKRQGPMSIDFNSFSLTVQYSDGWRLLKVRRHTNFRDFGLRQPSPSVPMLDSDPAVPLKKDEGPFL